MLAEILFHFLKIKRNHVLNAESFFLAILELFCMSKTASIQSKQKINDHFIVLQLFRLIV